MKYARWTWAPQVTNVANFSDNQTGTIHITTSLGEAVDVLVAAQEIPEIPTFISLDPNQGSSPVGESRDFTIMIGDGDGYNDIIYPIKKWNKFDVLYYLRKNDIPLPDSNERDGRGNTGIDLSASSVLWLHDKYHSDYLKLLEYFPFAECIIKRREYYGIK